MVARGLTISVWTPAEALACALTVTRSGCDEVATCAAKAPLRSLRAWTLTFSAVTPLLSEFKDDVLRGQSDLLLLPDALRRLLGKNNLIDDRRDIDAGPLTGCGLIETYSGHSSSR